MFKVIVAIVFVGSNSASASKNLPIDTDARVKKSEKSEDPFLSLVAAVSENFDQTPISMASLPDVIHHTAGDVPRGVLASFQTPSEFLQQLWTGDGERNTYEVLSEELVFVSFMRRHGLSSAKKIYEEISSLIPTTEWTLAIVQRRVRELLQSVLVPVWFHKICMERFAQGEPVDAFVVRLLTDRVNRGSYTQYDLASLGQMAHEWTNRCVRKMLNRDNRVPPCIEVSYGSDISGFRGFALSDVEIMKYLKDLEFVEAAKLVIADDYAAIVDDHPLPDVSGPIPEPRRLAVSERNILLRNAWTGDGEESQLGPWSEELVLLSHLRKHGPCPSTEIEDAIRARFPESRWTLETINRHIQRIAQHMVVPGWFHDICRANFERSGAVDSLMIQELAERQSTIKHGVHLELIERLATHWVDNCIRDIVAMVPSCVEVRVEPFMHRAFALSGPQITRFLRDLEIFEAVHLAFSQDSNPTSENGDERAATDVQVSKRAKTVERRTVKWHVLNRLNEQIDTSDEELVEIVNDSGFQVSIDDVRQIKADILAPTTQTAAHHNLMVFFSMWTEAASHSFDVFNSKNPGILTERQFNVWNNYCIQPLREMVKNNEIKHDRMTRPCTKDTITGLYTLSHLVGLSAYLADELSRESSRL